MERISRKIQQTGMLVLKHEHPPAIVVSYFFDFFVHFEEYLEEIRSGV